MSKRVSPVLGVMLVNPQNVLSEMLLTWLNYKQSLQEYNEAKYGKGTA